MQECLLRCLENSEASCYCTLCNLLTLSESANLSLLPHVAAVARRPTAAVDVRSTSKQAVCSAKLAPELKEYANVQGSEEVCSGSQNKSQSLQTDGSIGREGTTSCIQDGGLQQCSGLNLGDAEARNQQGGGEGGGVGEEAAARRQADSDGAGFEEAGSGSGSEDEDDGSSDGTFGTANAPMDKEARKVRVLVCV